ncbi:MAG: FAD-binding oxidoreductase [Alphaproteobacteria bacterium]|nr:FAD-binding oxidoreductase [Alphaproteobacteria bacterium]
MHVIVVGAGISGLSTAWAMTKRGHRVTLLERDVLPNPLAASGDQHRITRRAYRQRGYATRMTESFAAWNELWADLGREHMARVGVSSVSLKQGDRGQDYAEGLAAVGFSFETLRADAAIKRYPFLNPEHVREVYYSREGGALLCQRIAVDMAAWLQAKNVAIRTHAVVEAIDTEGASVTLRSGETLSADSVVVTAGAWASVLFPDLASTLVSHRTGVIFLEPPSDLRTAWSRAPAMAGLGVEGYVLPPVDGTQLKFGASFTRIPWHPDEPFEFDRSTALKVREVFAPLFARIGEYRIVGTRRCVYTFTEDLHFFAERRGATWIVSACSGHGYKFGTAVGRRVADALETGDDRTLVEWLAARD